MVWFWILPNFYIKYFKGGLIPGGILILLHTIASTHLLLILKRFFYLFFSWQDLWTLEMCGDPKRTSRCQTWSCFVLISKFLCFFHPIPPKNHLRSSQKVTQWDLNFVETKKCLTFWHYIPKCRGDFWQFLALKHMKCFS